MRKFLGNVVFVLIASATILYYIKNKKINNEEVSKPMLLNEEIGIGA